jgi:hypothetical protein
MNSEMKFAFVENTTNNENHIFNTPIKYFQFTSNIFFNFQCMRFLLFSEITKFEDSMRREMFKIMQMKNPEQLKQNEGKEDKITAVLSEVPTSSSLVTCENKKSSCTHMKNKKNVYIHRNNDFLQKKLERTVESCTKQISHPERKNSTQESSIAAKKVCFTNKNGKSKRSSQFRGVSRNGNQWQVLIMVNKKKLYLGSFAEEEEAARIYDAVALKYHGKRTKTNFLYTKDEINKISFLD